MFSDRGALVSNVNHVNVAIKLVSEKRVQTCRGEDEFGEDFWNDLQIPMSIQP